MNNINNEKISELRDAVENLISSAQSDKDIRMATFALNDLSKAISTLAPYKNHKKITIFGSARLKEDTEEYKATESLAKSLAQAGFTIITGGGPGLMHAGLQGAGGNGVGIAIELPFETVNHEVEVLNGWPLARQQMFFTRKLALIRNVNGFIVAPGGFGTLDEFFEVLTLIQTGKSKPAPIVLFETKQSPMWSSLNGFISEYLTAKGLVDPSDRILYHITSDIEDATNYISKFWSNYTGVHSEGNLVRLNYKVKPSDSILELINSLRSTNGVTEFEEDHLTLEFNLRHWCDLHIIIDAINKL